MDERMSWTPLQSRDEAKRRVAENLLCFCGLTTARGCDCSWMDAGRQGQPAPDRPEPAAETYDWRQPQVQQRSELAILARTGSHAYGTARPDSDDDFRGVYIVPTSDLFRLHRPAETFAREDPDVALHELGKFCALAAAANPTVLEVLWAEPLHLSPAGEFLRKHRHLFLSRRALKTYGGYATQQIRRAQAGTGGSRGQAHLRREKFLLHTLRLMETGIDLMRTGDLHLRVRDPDALWGRARRPLEQTVEEFDRLDVEMRAAADSSPLPAHPDEAAIDELLAELRWSMADPD